MIRYSAAFCHKPKSGWYTTSVFDFPGVLTQGRTLEQAQRMLHDALREMTECYLKEGERNPVNHRRTTLPRHRERNDHLVNQICKQTIRGSATRWNLSA